MVADRFARSTLHHNRIQASLVVSHPQNDDGDDDGCCCCCCDCSDWLWSSPIDSRWLTLCNGGRLARMMWPIGVTLWGCRWCHALACDGWGCPIVRICVLICFFFLFFKRFVILPYLNRHSLHWYGFSPLCIRRCFVSVELSENAFLHDRQLQMLYIYVTL